MNTDTATAGRPRFHALPVPPAPQSRPATGRHAAHGDKPHFWERGPGALARLPRPIYARGRRIEWRFRWFLNVVEGTSRAVAARSIYAVLRHQRSWERAGVVWSRTYDRAVADAWVNVLPMDKTACGPGAAGCYSWGYAEHPPLVEIGVEYVGDAAAWATILNMELCGHATFKALDMYNPAHQPYAGSLGTWSEALKVSGYPTDTEIAAARQWLRGETPAELLHED